MANKKSRNSIKRRWRNIVSHIWIIAFLAIYIGTAICLVMLIDNTLFRIIAIFHGLSTIAFNFAVLVSSMAYEKRLYDEERDNIIYISEHLQKKGNDDA